VCLVCRAGVVFVCHCLSGVVDNGVASICCIGSSRPLAST
jgi:hypothetical protein